MISTHQRQEIKFLQKMTFSADTVSDSMKIPVKEVCGVMGYPEDQHGRDKAAREYNFYDIDRVYFYSTYLQDGDFEKWQPVCYMNKLSVEFLNLQQEANHIPTSTDPVMEMTRLWILNRFTVYQKEEWKRILDLGKIQLAKIPELAQLSKKIALERYNSI